MQQIETNLLDIGYEVAGPTAGPVVLLLHGWPDDVRGWRSVAPLLHAAGFRTIAPFLRGTGPTRFLAAQTCRDGSGAALAQDAIDLADALDVGQFSVVGHDWGARVAYTLAALFPERITRIVALALAYQPRGAFEIPSFSQARRFWYQWFMCTDGGAEAIHKDPKGFARIQWDTWSPAGWFDDAEFNLTAQSFSNPDWTAITLQAYRSRWLPEEGDPYYHTLRERLRTVERIDVPALMIQGGSDFCDEPDSSAGQESFFTGGYRRVVLDDVGHFPAREAPGVVAETMVSHLAVDGLL